MLCSTLFHCGRLLQKRISSPKFGGDHSFQLKISTTKGHGIVRKFQSTTSTVQQQKGYNPISNKSTILKEIDAALGRNKPPAVEYIYVNPYWSGILKGYMNRTSHSALNPYGHSAIRYTMPSGEQKVMNIVGAPGQELVHFLTPEDYLFGLPNQVIGSEQGGIYQRTFITLRIEDVPPEKIVAMDNYFRELKERSVGNRDAMYSMAIGPIINWLRKRFLFRLLFGRIAERGNCAAWTSKGLVQAGLLPKPSMFPKLLWVRLLLNCVQNPDNFNTVVYKCMEKTKPMDGGRVSPFHWKWGRYFYDLHKLATVVVKVPPNSDAAQITIKRRPNRLFEILERMKINIQKTFGSDDKNKKP